LQLLQLLDSTKKTLLANSFSPDGVKSSSITALFELKERLKDAPFLEKIVVMQKPCSVQLDNSRKQNLI
jgi:hypothetical protein